MEGTSSHLEDGSLPDLTEVNILNNTGEEKELDRVMLSKQQSSQTDIGDEKTVPTIAGKFHSINLNLTKARGQIDDYVKTALTANKFKHDGKRNNNSNIRYKNEGFIIWCKYKY